MNESNPVNEKSRHSPAFFVVAGVLLLAAVGLNGATSYLKLSFRKLPVDLSRPLTEIPETLGPWRQASIDQRMSHEIEDALAAQQYVFRDFVDTRKLSPEEIEQFNNKSPAERQAMILQLRLKKPTAVLNVGLTYYTGLADTVAHVPERCYIAEGLESTNSQDAPFSSLAGVEGGGKVRYIDFEGEVTASRMSIKRNVAYFFHCNGKYMNDSIAVRKKLANLLDKYGYYMKVEMQTLNLPSDQAEAVMDDFIGHLRPELEKTLPNWATYSRDAAERSPANAAQ
jgi:hypothetical protein